MLRTVPSFCIAPANPLAVAFVASTGYQEGTGRTRPPAKTNPNPITAVGAALDSSGVQRRDSDG